MDWQALTLSLKLAGTTCVLLLTVGLPITYALARRRHGSLAFIEALFSLPMLLPPTVLGFYLLLLLGPLKLAFSFTGLLIASFISGLAFSFPAFLAAFRAVDHGYFENSLLLGDSKWRTFSRVALPLARDGIMTGAILAFAHAMGEFGVVLMIGGSIPGLTRTLSLALYDEVTGFNYPAANRTAAFLLLFNVGAIALVSYLRSRERLR